MTTEREDEVREVMAVASLAAVFFRTLLDQDVPMAAAVQMACSYVSANAIARNQDQRPRMPWEPEEE